MKTNITIELTAPAGSYESLMAAIQGGANSIYFGVEKMNMRAKSTFNFVLDDLPKITSICRQHNIKSYLTLNSVLYDQEIELMKSIVDAAKDSGIDAIIATDYAVINYANSKSVSVHVSTQSNVSNIEAVRHFSKFADAIVLARELSLEQVKNITAAITKENITGPSGKPVRIEIFGHGALCMSISGKCYLSLHEQNHSANRGECLQICRKAYTVKEQEGGNELTIDNEYIMSPKDLCTIDFLDKVISAGVSILKLEGRARSPEYVKTVTQCYREAIDSFYEGTYSKEKTDVWKEKLKTVFNRGFWDGYYLGRRLGEWSEVYGSDATTKKIYIAKCMNYFSNLKVADFLIETGELNLGDNILITGPTTGVIETSVKEIRVELENKITAVKGQRCSIPVEETVRRADKLYKIMPKV